MEPISVSFAAIRLALDGLKGASETLNRAKIEEAVTSVRTALISAQETALALQVEATEREKERAKLERRVAELEKELEGVTDWRTRAKCYSLKPTLPNSETFVMEFDLQKGQEHGIAEPFHRACPACFQQRKLSVLFQSRPSVSTIQCPVCDFKVYIREPSPAASVPTIRSRGNWVQGY